MLEYCRQTFFRYIKANIAAYFFVILILMLGALVGALAAKTLSAEQIKELLQYLQVFFQGLNQHGIQESADLLVQVIYANAKIIGLIWLLGFTIVGIPFVLFLIFIRGFVIGFTVGFLVNEYVFKGLLFALVSVLPHNFLAIPAILVSGVAAISFSLLLLRRKAHMKVNLLFASFTYTALCFFMFIAMLFSSVIEVYISPVFMKLLTGMFLNQ